MSDAGTFKALLLERSVSWSEYCKQRSVSCHSSSANYKVSHVLTPSEPSHK